MKKESQYDYLRRNGEVVLSTDKIYHAPLFNINIDGWYTNSVRLCPETKESLQCFQCWLERTPPSTTSESSNFSCCSKVTVLVCPCHKNNIEADESIKHLKKLTHFHCHCEDDIFNLCQKFIFNELPGMHDKCFYKDLGPFDVCKYRVERRYHLNFRSYKFCFKTVPKNI